MIEKILERLREKQNYCWEKADDEYYEGKAVAYDETIEIVQEVAKEYEGKTVTISVDIGDLANSVEYGKKAPYQKGE